MGSMGWIGGVAGAWQSCLSEKNQTKSNHHNSISDSYFLKREIEREMHENNCITLEEKRSYLLRISMFDMKHMPYRRGVIQGMLNDIEWKMQEEHQKETQNINILVKELEIKEYLDIADLEGQIVEGTWSGYVLTLKNGDAYKLYDGIRGWSSGMFYVKNRKLEEIPEWNV